MPTELLTKHEVPGSGPRETRSSVAVSNAPFARTRRFLSRHASRIRKGLLACGIGYGVAYIVANDVIAARIFDGYSRLDQAISELSGTKAPSKDFLTAILPIFSLLVIGFGVGVWKSARGNRPLRVVGATFVVQGALFPLWLLFPMTSREEMVPGTTPTNDAGHIALSVLALVFILTEMGFGAAALGTRFRVFTIAAAATALVSGTAMQRLNSGIAEGDPTQWMGFAERIAYGSWLLWMAVLAIALLRRDVALDREAARTGVREVVIAPTNGLPA